MEDYCNHKRASVLFLETVILARRQWE